MSQLSLSIGGAYKVPGETLPEWKDNGSTVGLPTYGFSSSSNEAIEFALGQLNYDGSSGCSVLLPWTSLTATSGQVVWGVSFAHYTYDTDTGSTTGLSWTTEQTVADSHLGTTATRGMLATVTFTDAQMGSPEDGDFVLMRVRRLPGSESGGMASDAELSDPLLEYTAA